MVRIAVGSTHKGFVRDNLACLGPYKCGSRQPAAVWLERRRSIARLARRSVVLVPALLTSNSTKPRYFARAYPVCMAGSSLRRRLGGRESDALSPIRKSLRPSNGVSLPTVFYFGIDYGFSHMRQGSSELGSSCAQLRTWYHPQGK